jgi:hypothetical protein
LDKENKKKLKTFLQLILQYIDDIEYLGVNEYFKNNCRHYIELGIVFPDVLNSYFKEKFSSFEKLLNDKFTINDKFIEFIKYGMVLCYLSLINDLTNQFSFNYTVILTQLIKKVEPKDTNNLLVKTILLSNLILMAKFSQLYNPFITNTIEVVLLRLVDIQTISINEDFNQIKQFFTKEDNININMVKERIIELTTRSLHEFSIILKNDINYDTIFDRIFTICYNILNSQAEFISIHSIYIVNIEPKFQPIVKILQLNIERSKSKKCMHINFFVEKIKEIESLNPEIDPEYDFSLSWGEKKNLLKKKTQNNIVKKVKKTKREAIRNLKKESRLIDMERQKEKAKIDQKRKEEIKLSNQFIEQTNLEYKKLRTSQTKRKEKKKRETRKAGNQV